MPTSDFLPFGTAGGAPVLSNAAWASTAPANGFPAGILPKEKLNKAIRQSSAMSAALGQFCVLRGQDALDDGDITALRDSIVAALNLQSVAFFQANQNLVADGGFVRLPGGCIFQWGVVHVGDIMSTTGSVVYPLPFPAATLRLMFTVEDASSSPQDAAFVTAKSATGFSYKIQEWSVGVQDSSIAWLAIGN